MKKEVELVPSGDMDEFFAEDQDLESFELCEALQIALSKLNAHYRMMIEAQVLDEMTMEEIKGRWYQPYCDMEMVCGHLATAFIRLREMRIHLSCGRDVSLRDFL